MRATRKLITVDEALCNGCGNCVTGCAEGALAIIDGKARLVNEVFCDGLGACLGECPTGALTVVEVEAEDFNPDAVVQHLTSQGREVPGHMPDPASLRLHPKGVGGQAPASRPHAPTGGGCPGSRVMSLKPQGSACQQANVPVSQPVQQSADQSGGSSNLSNWPIQLRLVPPTAAHYASMHEDFARRRRTEIDALNGAIVRMGAECGVACPVNAWLTDLIHAREAAMGR